MAASSRSSDRPGRTYLDIGNRFKPLTSPALAAGTAWVGFALQRSRGLVDDERGRWKHYREERMGIGVSVFLLVVGAILAFAVEVTASGFSINTVGIILMVGGVIGLLFSLLLWSRRGPVAGGAVIEERVIDRELP